MVLGKPLRVLWSASGTFRDVSKGLRRFSGEFQNIQGSFKGPRLVSETFQGLFIIISRRLISRRVLWGSQGRFSGASGGRAYQRRFFTFSEVLGAF